MTPHDPSTPSRRTLRSGRRDANVRFRRNRTRNAPPLRDLDDLTVSLLGTTADMLAEAHERRQPKEGS